MHADDLMLNPSSTINASVSVALPSIASPEGVSGEQQQQQQKRPANPDDYMKPWSNVTTIQFGPRNFFYSGFRNQIMAFTMFVLEALHEKHGQILINRLQLRDTPGKRALIPFQTLFDIRHWNSFYPNLPRIVTCDPQIFTECNC
jgi:hypothetical protein